MRNLQSYIQSALLIVVMAFALSPVAVRAVTPFPYGGDPSVAEPGAGISAGLDQLETRIDEGQSGIIQEDSLKKLVNDWTSFFLQYYMIVAVGLVIYLGVRLVLSQGSEEQRGKTIQAFVNLAIGTAIIFLSYVIVNQVVSIVSPDTGTQTVNQIESNTRKPGSAATTGTTSTPNP